MIDRVCKKTGAIQDYTSMSIVKLFKDGVSWSQSSVFRFYKCSIIRALQGLIDFRKLR